MKTKKYNQRGVIAIFTIVVVAAATLIMASSAAWLGIGELDLGYTSQRGGEAFAVADGCIEEALRRVRLDINYNGGSLALGNGTCIIEVGGTGNSRTVTVTGTVLEYNKKIEVELTLTGNIITIDSWREL